MSKSDPTATKSLEQILASIRKSLADEPPAHQPEPPPAAPVKAAQPDPTPPAPAASDPIKANGADVLAGKLAAGLLNGVSRSSAPDDDLSDLLAAAPKQPTPPEPVPVHAPKPGEAKSNARDPLWFLSRLSAAAADAVSPGAAGRDAAKAAAPRVEDVKLSRPETLRPSLPPLFGGGSEPIPPAAAREEAKDVSLTAKTEPRGAPRQVNGEARTAKPEPEVAAIAPAPAPVIQATPPAAPVDADRVAKAAPPPTASAPEPAPTVAKVVPPQAPTKVEPATPVAKVRTEVAKEAPSPATSALQTASTVAAVVAPPAPAKVEPAVPLAKVRAEPEPEQAPPAADSGPASGPEPAGALPTRGFEQAVGELLEPVIRQWLQSNLPRMIEKSVREEVVRALAAERAAAKK